MVKSKIYISVTINPTVLKQFDAYCRERASKRSTMIEHLIREVIKNG